ncbi:hypothetical protein S40293_10074 [Stachybotrys chartarum IBT 40293]|nr:hypothetical protein S40293_10074 [Stachybotrys chartarum IBT 40293]
MQQRINNFDGDDPAYAGYLLHCLIPQHLFPRLIQNLEAHVKEKIDGKPVLNSLVLQLSDLASAVESRYRDSGSATSLKKPLIRFFNSIPRTEEEWEKLRRNAGLSNKSGVVSVLDVLVNGFNNECSYTRKSGEHIDAYLARFANESRLDLTKSKRHRQVATYRSFIFLGSCCVRAAIEYDRTKKVECVRIAVNEIQRELLKKDGSDCQASDKLLQNYRASFLWLIKAHEKIYTRFGHRGLELFFTLDRAISFWLNNRQSPDDFTDEFSKYLGENTTPKEFHASLPFWLPCFIKFFAGDAWSSLDVPILNTEEFYRQFLKTLTSWGFNVPGQACSSNHPLFETDIITPDDSQSHRTSQQISYPPEYSTWRTIHCHSRSSTQSHVQTDAQQESESDEVPEGNGVSEQPPTQSMSPERQDSYDRSSTTAQSQETSDADLGTKRRTTQRDVATKHFHQESSACFLPGSGVASTSDVQYFASSESLRSPSQLPLHQNRLSADTMPSPRSISTPSPGRSESSQLVAISSPKRVTRLPIESLLCSRRNQQASTFSEDGSSPSQHSLPHRTDQDMNPAGTSSAPQLGHNFRDPKRRKTQWNMDCLPQRQSPRCNEELNFGPRDVPSPWNGADEIRPSGSITPFATLDSRSPEACTGTIGNDERNNRNNDLLSFGKGLQSFNVGDNGRAEFEMTSYTCIESPPDFVQESLLLDENIARELSHGSAGHATVTNDPAAVHPTLSNGEPVLCAHCSNGRCVHALGSVMSAGASSSARSFQSFDKNMANLFHGTDIPAMKLPLSGLAPSSRSPPGPTDDTELQGNTIYNDITAMSGSSINIDDFFDFELMDG